MELIDKYISLTEEEIANDYIKIKEYHQKYLQSYGIVMPAENTNAAYQLIYLFHFLGKSIHKDVISNFVLSQNPNASGDQQIRHLGAQKGYCVIYNGDTYNGEKIKRGYYCLFTLEKPNPSWISKQNARAISVTTSDFDIIKKNYNNCCATCGAKEGTVHRYSGQIVKLQKGHCNPNLPLEKGNIIPQCQYCNQNIYKDDFIFTTEGRPQSINNPKYILKSSDIVQKAMYEILKEKFG